MSVIECESLTFGAGNWTCEYTGTFNPGKWHIVCGESGSGKSTLLRLLTGLLRPTGGNLKLNGHGITDLAPHKRKMSFMSQENALFPGVSVFENLMLALHDAEISRAEARHAIEDLTNRLGISGEMLSRMPSALSGGQLSRCNLARALLRPATWLLLDEPFAAVDRPTRLSILGWLKNWTNASGTGIILVSHDLDDIFTVATDVTVIADGKIVENCPLTLAIESPSHVSTARLLRAGLVYEENDVTYFVPPSAIHTSKESLTCGEQITRGLPLHQPQVTKLGKGMRVIDLSTGCDLFLPWDQDFRNTLWFDFNKAHKMSG